MPQQFIAIVGSASPNRTFDPPLKNLQQAVTAAQDLGRELARAGYGIVVYSSHPDFIEPHVVTGYLMSGRAADKSIQVRHPKRFPTTYDPNNRVFDIQADNDPDWEVSFYQSIRATEGMLLLGGGYSTIISGITAIPDRKPLIAISCFGGGAERVETLLSPENLFIDGNDKLLMQQIWQSDSAQKLVACLQNQMQKFIDWQNARKASESQPEVVENGVRIAWLSDLHIAREEDKKPFTMRSWLGGLFRFKGSPLTQNFPATNLEAVLQRINALKPDHILVTGDCTNYATDRQFDDIVALFKSTQQVLREASVLDDLNPSLWTVLPGNHDVTDEDPAKGKERHNLGMFFRHFQSLYPGTGPDYDNAFPVEKSISSKYPNGLRVRLLGLDSTVSDPVWKVGYNARGRIDELQSLRLDNKLAANGNSLSLVAMHHHPIVMPFISSDIHAHFMELYYKDANNLIKICANTGVSAILHGHYHEYSFWSTLVPQGTHKMAIVGSPAGTRDLPGNIEFFELREAQRDTVSGRRMGLALYRHARRQNVWNDEYVAFIESKQLVGQ